MIIPKQIQRPQMVLVVDDKEINRDSLEMILEEGYEVITAENGAQALELMRSHAKELSIVLLDLIMPVMSGYEVLKTVRGDEILKKIPIIVMTADFITKPFDLHEVISARVGRIIELSEGRKLISTAVKIL